MLERLLAMRSNTALRTRYAEIARNNQDALAENRMTNDRLVDQAVGGVLLLIGPDQFPRPLVETIAQAQQQIKANEPNIHLTDLATLHIGVFIFNPTYNYDMDGASGEKRIYNGGSVYQESYYQAYREVVNSVIRPMTPLAISLAGIGASTGAIFLQGYDNGVLNQLRANLLTQLDSSGLPFADRTPDIVHSTLARFSGRLNDPAAFLDRVKQLSKEEFGSLTVQKMIMVAETKSYFGEHMLISEFNLGV
jgi:2'-5' RNA ligase